MTLTATFTALDQNGRTIPGISIGTAFGSERGLLVIPPDGSFDILTFAGERVGEVADVSVDVQTVSRMEGFTLSEEIEPQPVADGVEVTQFDAFSEVEVRNPSNGDIALRIVCIEYDIPAPGEAQQAVEISEVVRVLRLSAEETKTVPVAAEFGRRTDALGYGRASLKTHLTDPAVD